MKSTGRSRWAAARWRAHLPWLGITAVVMPLALTLHAAAVRGEARAPGGTRYGLALGAAAALCLVLAGLLGARRPLVRYSSLAAASWVRAHLWLGGLALTLSLLHAGLPVRGPLGTAMLVTLGLVTASGLLGLWLQSALPGTIDALAAGGSARGARRAVGMQRWLHAWLLVHVPIAMGLLVLVAVHAIVALRY